MSLRNSHLTFFSPVLPSFADNLVKMDHTHDADLYRIYRDVNHQFFPTTYSPLPADEFSEYEKLPDDKKKYMLIRNPLLLSRLFIRNATLNDLSKHFDGEKKIRILDIGCGYAANLVGILAYFGPERVSYLGIDIEKQNIQTATLAYSNFKNISFMTQDAIAFLSKTTKNNQLFDLILVQHPNFQTPATQSIFKEIFFNLTNALAPSGIIYSTFYSRSEVDYFQTHVQPHIDELKDAALIETNAYSDQAKFIDEVTHEKQASEQYILMSSLNKENVLVSSHNQLLKR